MGSEDGDTMPALMATYSTRRSLRPAGKPPGRVYWRRTQIIAYTADTRGVKTKVDQPEWIDTDLLAEYVEHTFCGLLSEGLLSAQSHAKLKLSDPIAFCCLLELMSESDYAEGFKGLTSVNIMRGTIDRPDLARQVLSVAPRKKNANKRLIVDEARPPQTCLIHAESMRAFIRHCYSIAHKNRVSSSKFPAPCDEAIDAVVARISWTLDKVHLLIHLRIT